MSVEPSARSALTAGQARRAGRTVPSPHRLLLDLHFDPGPDPEQVVTITRSAVVRPFSTIDEPVERRAGFDLPQLGLVALRGRRATT